ncbi:MAG TPA: hypothetical protein VF826_02555 [Chloroflexia bacterium]|jgi:hypothetical protein
MKRSLLLLAAVFFGYVIIVAVVHSFSRPWQVPQYPDSLEIHTTACYQQFVAKDGPERVLSYYQEKMPDEGWIYSPEHSRTMADAIYFERGDYFAIIAIVRERTGATTFQVTVNSYKDPFPGCGDGS